MLAWALIYCSRVFLRKKNTTFAIPACNEQRLCLCVVQGGTGWSRVGRASPGWAQGGLNIPLSKQLFLMLKKTNKTGTYFAPDTFSNCITFIDQGKLSRKSPAQFMQTELRMFVLSPINILFWIMNVGCLMDYCKFPIIE